jgi:hypothetical protein|tara:strand:- start:576 stop:773 length:198 start_codon:yes stop_codon:yes gene_type:complete
MEGVGSLKHKGLRLFLSLVKFFTDFDQRYQKIYSEATEGMDAFGCAVLWHELERCPVDRLDSNDR